MTYGPTTFEGGTIGGNIGAAAWGADSKAGTGTSVYRATGLFGSTRAALLTAAVSSVSFKEAVTGDETWVGFDFQADAPPSAVSAMVKAESAAGVVQASIRVTQKGIINFKALDADPVVGTTDAAYMGNPDAGGEIGPDPELGREHHLLWRLEHATGRQTCWVWRDGHFVKVGGDEMVIGPDPITQVYVGIPVQSSWVLTIDNPLVTDVAQPIPEPTGVVYQWSGAPTETSVQVAVNTLSDSAVRARFYRSGTLDVARVTDAVPIPAGKQRVTMTADGLAPGTLYDYTLEGFNAISQTWGEVGVAGKVRTAPVRGYPWSGIIAGYACELNKTMVEKTSQYLLTRSDIDYWVHGGDLYYDNITETGSPSLFRNAITERFAEKTDFAAFAARTTMLDIRFSDHDGGGGNDAVTQHAATADFHVAYLDSVPHWPLWNDPSLVKTDPEAFTKSTSGDIGRVHFTCPDFRWLGRSASTDPDTDAKIAYKPSDEARIIAEIDDASYPLVVLVSDPPWVGSAAEVSPKDDHLACYPNQRGRINAAIARRLARGQGFFGWFFDYHALALREAGTTIDDTGGGAAWGGSGGAANNTGNLRTDDLPNYDQYAHEAQGGGDDYDIWVHTELEITDDGETITLRFIGRDNNAASAVLVDTGVMSWDAPFTAPDPGPAWVELGDLRIPDPVGRFLLLEGADLLSTPGKSAAVARLNGSHGQRIGNVWTDSGGRKVLPVFVSDSDAAGRPGGRAQVDRNLNALKGFAASRRRQTMRTVTHLDLLQTEVEAPGFVLSSMPVQYLGNAAARATITVELEREWRSTTPSYWVRDFTDGDMSGERVSVLDGSTHPVPLVWRCSGSMFRFKITDALTGEWAKVDNTDAIEADPGTWVGEDQAVVVGKIDEDGNLVPGWRVWLIDDDAGWDVTDGADVSGWLSSSASSEVPLYLTPGPSGGDPFDRAVIVDLNIGPRAGSPVLQIKTWKAVV